MALEDTFAGDLASIRSTMLDAVAHIWAMIDGRVWDDGLTGTLAPSARIQTITILERKVGAINDWIDVDGKMIGTPTPMQYVLLNQFITNWSTEEKTNSRFRYWCFNTSVEPPVRGKAPEDQPVFTPASTDAASGANIPIVNPTAEHEEPNPQS